MQPSDVSTSPAFSSEPATVASAPAASAVPPAGLLPILPGAADADFVDRLFAYLLVEFPQISGPRFAQARRAIREELGGERVYVATRSTLDRHALAQEALSLFDGRNATEVARRLNISRATVYRLLKQPRR